MLLSSFNERGCVLFRESLKALQERREYMSIVEDSVREMYSEGGTSTTVH